MVSNMRSGDASPPSCRITQKLKQPCKLTMRYEQINQVIRKRERHSLEALRHIDGAANHMRLVVPAPLVLGESYGSRCQPTAAARGKPMTSTNGSGGHGFVPPKPMRVQDADTTRLSRTGIRPDVTMPIQNKTRACATQHHTNNYNK